MSRVPADRKLPLRYWQGTIELPSHNGERRRKFLYSKNKADLIEKLREADRQVKQRGDLPTRDITIEQWINEWFNSVAVFELRPKTANNYRSLIRLYLIPSIGQKRLDRLSPADVRSMHAFVLRKGKSSTTARHVHMILSGALGVALDEGKVGRNVATVVKAPRKAPYEIQALTLEEGLKVLETAMGDRYESLWWAALMTGQRQGELAGLEIDRVTDELDISWQLQRLSWEHGCDPHCGWKQATHCRKRKITHPADWEGRNIHGGLWLTRPKSESGVRVIPLVDPLASILRLHLQRQEADEPNPYGLVWHTPEGNPIDPGKINEMWHELLERAGVRIVRFHDARHTAVDLLLEAGVHEDLIQEIIGHSTRAQTRAYKTRGNQKRLKNAFVKLSDMVMQRDGESSEKRALAG